MDLPTESELMKLEPEDPPAETSTEEAEKTSVFKNEENENEEEKTQSKSPPPPPLEEDQDTGTDGSYSQHRSVIVPVASLSGGENESSVRSESVNSSGSCEREETTASPTFQGMSCRRRSTRLRTDRLATRKSAEKGDNDNEDDHLEGSETTTAAGDSKPASNKKRSKDRPDYTMRNIAPERQMNPALNVMWDGFCWRCHKPVPLTEQHGCPSCVRIFHRECWWNDAPYSSKDHVLDVHPLHAAFGHNLEREMDDSNPMPQDCIECFCVLEEEKKEDSIFNRVGMEKFQKYLRYMMRFVDDHLPPERVRPFAVPVLEQDECSESVKDKYAEYITRPMDLRQIGQNIDEGKYNTCASFLADLRWIYHNTSIFNGQNNRYTRSASYIVETCQHLCYSLEWCMECFERGMPINGESIHEAVERGMITPCSDPHAVVWVKADKFPIWPAIVYRFNGSVADVRFFGAFEFGVFPKDAIFLFSKGGVTDRRKGRLKLDYENALRQFRLHVSKLRQIPNKELIAYPKKTQYDGRLWMFPEGEEYSALSLSDQEPPVAPPTLTSHEETLTSQGGTLTSHGEPTDMTDVEGVEGEEGAEGEEVVKGEEGVEGEDGIGGEGGQSKGFSAPGRLEQLIMRSRTGRDVGLGRGLKEKRSRSGSLSDDGSRVVRKRRLERSLTPSKDETVAGGVEATGGSTGNGENRPGRDLSEPGRDLSDLSAFIPDSLSVSADGKRPTSDMEVADSEGVAVGVGSPKTDDVGSRPATPTETVKPVFFESDSDTELPSFELPEDVDETKIARPAGKLDYILKRPVAPSGGATSSPLPLGGATSSPLPVGGATGSPLSVGGTTSSGLPVGGATGAVASSSRNTALTQELNKSLGGGSSGGPKSVLHDALVRPYQQHPQHSQQQGGQGGDVFSNILRRQPKTPSMVAGGQSHLIEALRSSPRPMASSGDSQSRRLEGNGGGSGGGVGGGVGGSGGGEGRRQGREETLGSLLAAGSQSRNFMGGASDRLNQAVGGALDRLNQVGGGASDRLSQAVGGVSGSGSGNRPILPKVEGVSDGRRINAVSNQLNLAAARNAQARTGQTSSDGSSGSNQNQQELNLNRSILARSLNGSSPSGSSPSLQVNGGRASPLALQTAMRSLVRPSHSPNQQESSRNVGVAGAGGVGVTGGVAGRRFTPPESVAHVQTESVQAQIDLFLRNTKKIVKEKKDEVSQIVRETSQTHSDNLRLLHEAQLKCQQRTEKMIQELQETMEQSIRKFELLFMVFHSENEFSQKSKILEVSRMKDLERQRAVTSAKRTLWCCVCQKRARLICCGVTMYCSEACHLNNASLHRLHCRRLNMMGEDDGSVDTPYGVLVRCSLLPPGLEDEEEVEGRFEGSNGWNGNGNGVGGVGGSGGPGGSGVGGLGARLADGAADSVEVIDVSQDEMED